MANDTKKPELTPATFKAATKRLKMELNGKPIAVTGMVRFIIPHQKQQKTRQP